ncbi:MAG TPA: class I SAM-dependent methyltransferase [Alphaproteobacteria bacterium]|nr:class I SAM-dependent methyltransferase [Alphaproteobacteria bacterium]
METINAILFWVLLFVLGWQAYILIFNRGIPNIRTAPALRRAMIDKLKEAGAKRIYDLGSGGGDLSRTIAAALPDAKVTGLEISAGAVRRAQGRGKHLPNLEYIQGDFMKADLSQADALVMFLIDTMMPPLREKLRKELKPGTIVISNKFPLGGDWVPAEELSIKTLYLNQKMIYLYRA